MPAERPSSRARRSLTLHLGVPCCAGPLCSCRLPAVPERARRQAMRGGGERLILRGAPLGEALRAQVEAARAARFERVLWAGQAHLLADEGLRGALREAGVDGVLAPLYSAIPKVHARLVGRAEAGAGGLPEALLGLRAALREGLGVELELPLLPLRLGDPKDGVELVARALPGVGRLHLFAPAGATPAALRPDPITLSGPRLRAALEAARAHGLAVAIGADARIPLCALAEGPERAGSARSLPPEAPRLRPGAAGSRGGGQARYALACEGCAAKPSCGGLSEAYLAAHRARSAEGAGEGEDEGLLPFASRPPRLRRGGAERPLFGEAEREAARRIHSLVLRPTVHCNQDCLFCSANESSKNVWGDPKAMLRKIARAGQRGLMRVAFSGGEPTLSPHLPDFVAAASRVGIMEVEVVTNGVLLDRPERVRRLAEAGLTHAFVSLHAHDEALSRVMTQKRGDHARTLRAIELLLEAGVKVAVNHVITSRNYPFLRAFVQSVAERFGGRVPISFAFVTPQYKSLSHAWLLPRLSEVLPELRRALVLAFERGQPFLVGSRQGIPPCLLGPFRSWSDVVWVAAEAAAEDGPQKERGPACGRCRFRELCQGLWTPYARRHGFSELAPVEGEPFTAVELEALKAHHPRPPWEPIASFSELHPLLRDPAAEAAWLEAPGRSDPGAPEAPAAPSGGALGGPRRHLEVLRSRPLRLLMVGSGRRARRLLEAAGGIPEAVFEAVASPHAPEAAAAFGGRPAYRSLAAALEGMRPEAVVIAAATEAHHALAVEALEAGLPVLLEKPVTATLEEAARLAEAAARSEAWVMPAHNLSFAVGLRPFLRELGEGPLALRWSLRAEGPEAPRSWSERSLYELLIHAFSVLAPRLPAARLGGAAPVRVLGLRGEGRPERIELSLGSSQRPDLRLDLRLAAEAEELCVRGSGADGSGAGGEASYLRRRGGEGFLERGGAREPLPREGSEDARMLRLFARAVQAWAGEGVEPEPVPPLEEGIFCMRAASAALFALREAGAPFERPGAPRHASSAALRWRLPE